MTNWILIILMYNNVAYSVEFNSRTACEAALTTIEKGERFGQLIDTYCVQKG